jgi:hypothetical protein
MDIFAETAGFSAQSLGSALEWLLTFATCIFGTTVIRRGYQQWLKKEITGIDLFMDLILLIALMMFVAIVFIN